MKLASQKLCFAAATSALALLLAGCPHKPDRPGPNQTVLGQGAGPSPVAMTNVGPSAVSGTDLVARDNGPFDEKGFDRTTLQGSSVYFDLNQSDIKQAERAKLKAVKEYLDKNPTHKVLLEGHCDWRGTAEYNLALGERRANAVKKYLQTLGVPETRLETLSKGSLDANKEGGEAVWAKDRRTDTIVIDPTRAGPKAI